ncbi:Coiled-coil domain-containing protein 97 [Halocaridina rubra]|uniref:Coiled-coil domain-containing protein 97 n=1 Tax=Halocaridina rubra TaxID=373956 RepID=A0AAN8WGK7_HALRR
MWGEFDKIEEKENVEKVDSCVSAQSPVTENIDELPLRDRIIHHIASSSAILKSQQRYEPDPTFEERKTIAGELLDKPGIFLYRFGKLLQREHFQYFMKYEGDPEVDHYITESLKHMNKHTARVRIQNRRYAAMQELRRSSEYFSEKEMERRNPLLYDQLIAQHQTSEERLNYTDNNDKDSVSFSSLLLEHIDKRDEKNLKKLQEEEEDDMFEEEETDEEEGNDNIETIDPRQKELYREEFYSASYHSFLRGKDEAFDYSKIDASDDYDLLDIQARDEEERYFDDDDDENEDYAVNLEKNIISTSEKSEFSNIGRTYDSGSDDHMDTDAR